MKTTPPALPPDPTRAFQPTADPASLWLTGQYDDTLRVLRSAVTGRQGLLALVGESGTGKTVLAHALATRLRREDTVVVGRLLYPILEGMDMVAAVAEAFGLSVAFRDRGGFIEAFRRFVADTVAGGRRVLLVVDEAQRPNREVLIELARLPYADGRDAAASLSVLLVGRRGLLDALRAEAVEPDVLCHLGPLTREQTAQYIAHRLGVIRHRGRLFTPSALQKIWVVSEGVPQAVNTLCVEAIGHRSATGRRTVTAAMVDRAPRAAEEVSVPEPVVAPIEAPRIERPPRELRPLRSQRPRAPRRRQFSLVGAACIVLVIVGIWAVKRSDRLPAFLAGPQTTTASPVPDDGPTDQVRPSAAPADGPIEAALEASVASHIAAPPPLPDRPERPAPTASRPRVAVPSAKSASVSDDGDGMGIIEWLLARRHAASVPRE
jgi:type II secretory pathway predicted ATPase ExeA